MSETASKQFSSTTITDNTTMKMVRRLLLVGLFSLIFYAYGVQLVGPDISTYIWLVSHWKTVSNYSHGPLIPLIASFLLWWNISKQSSSAGFNGNRYWIAFGCTAGLMLLPDLMPVTLQPKAQQMALYTTPFLFTWQIWELRGELMKLIDQPTTYGLPIVVLAVGLYYIGIKAVQPHAVVLSFVILLMGIVLALWGPRLFRATFFPTVFLTLMIPLNFLEEQVGLPLRHLMAQMAVGVLNLIGIEALRIGTGIYSTVFKFDVAAPCSGIRSLMALTTVTAAYAYVTQESLWKKWLLFLSAMPLAVLGNLGRVTLIALVAQTYGEKVAMRLHDTVAGFVVFGIALSTMLLMGWLLNFPYRQLWQRWTQPVSPKELSHEQQPNTL